MSNRKRKVTATRIILVELESKFEVDEDTPQEDIEEMVAGGGTPDVQDPENDDSGLEGATRAVLEASNHVLARIVKGGGEG